MGNFSTNEVFSSETTWRDCTTGEKKKKLKLSLKENIRNESSRQEGNQESDDERTEE